MVCGRRINSTRRLNETEKEIDRLSNLPDPLTMERERAAEIHQHQTGMLDMVITTLYLAGMDFCGLLNRQTESMKRAILEEWTLCERFGPKSLLLEREREQVPSVSLAILTGSL